jgi:hypothetical protein
MSNNILLKGQIYTIHVKRVGNAIQFTRSENELTEKVGYPIIEKDRFWFDSVDAFLGVFKNF